MNAGTRAVVACVSYPGTENRRGRPDRRGCEIGSVPRGITETVQLATEVVRDGASSILAAVGDGFVGALAQVPFGVVLFRRPAEVPGQRLADLLTPCVPVLAERPISSSVTDPSRRVRAR